MRHQDIQVGDTLKLKSDNAYGFGSRLVEVVGIEQRDGYATPWIRGLYYWTNETNGNRNMDFGHFKPSDFKENVS